MVSIINTEVTNFRAFGWVQDPGNFRSLCNVVAVFVKDSAVHNLLVNNTIPRLVLQDDGKDQLLEQLNSDILPLKLSYRALVGTSFTPRSASRCNGIIQATVKGQKRDFIGDWPADNFLRWAHALGFVKYDYNDDTFSVTQIGLDLVNASDNSTELNDREKEILTKAILSYPPAMRVLSLLANENAHLTKFEIGKQLGFIGEGGFTSQPQNLLIMELSQTTDARLRNDMKSDWEGSSDKYARMIAKWLCNLGLVRMVPKEICVCQSGVEYRETITQAYTITVQGLRSYKAALGNSRHPRITKNVYYELFSPSGKDREYLRLRRSYIVKYLSENTSTTMDSLIEYLKSVNIEELPTTIFDDIKGLINIGLDIEISEDNIIFKDKISDFSILIPRNAATLKTDISIVKDNLRNDLNYLSHEYLSLIDLAYDSKQNRLFEMKTMDLFINEYGFKGLHLGGSRKPDGIMYTENLNRNYGVIVDTKAYSKGYNLPISQADEMTRYILENQRRNENENPNKWWKHFDDSIEDFNFLFVSGHFKGNFEEQLKRISLTTSTYGAALSVAMLLICADMILGGLKDLNTLKTEMFNNIEYKI